MPIEEITTTVAMERLHLTRKQVTNLIHAGKLNARLQDAPSPYFLIRVDSKFLEEEKRRSQLETDPA